MKRITRPLRDASKAERMAYYAKITEALAEMGVGHGEDFIVAKWEPQSKFAPPTADAAQLGPSVDVDTSRKAALANVPKSGTQRATVLDYVESCGHAGATREEISEALGMGGDTVRPRCLELIEGGWLEATPARRTTRSGEQAEVLARTPRNRDGRMPGEDPTFFSLPVPVGKPTSSPWSTDE